jgi:hypothetical protein
MEKRKKKFRLFSIGELVHNHISNDWKYLLVFFIYIFLFIANGSMAARRTKANMNLKSQIGDHHRELEEVQSLFQNKIQPSNLESALSSTEIGIYNSPPIVLKDK